jgi:hypothetical protein
MTQRREVMQREITPEEWSRHFRSLARKRWQARRRRNVSGQAASRYRWERFHSWQANHPEEAAAAAAVAKALRALRPKPEVTDDEIIERLERRLSKAQQANAALLPWGDEFKRRARRKES